MIPASRAKPFWHDEIYTILMSRLPSVGAMWAAGLDGVDLSPPLNLWLTRAVHAVAGVGYVQTRVPPTLGFLTMVLAMLALLWRRTGAVSALSAALVPFLTAGLRFAYEARPYGVMMGLSALSLYAWMEAAAGRRRRFTVPLLWIALAASIWNHYFGLLVFVPIVAGECARIVQRRQIDGAVAAAVGLAVASAVPLYPLVQASAAQRATFWSPANASQIPQTYVFVLNALTGIVAAAVAIAIVLLLIHAARASRQQVTEDRAFVTHEAVAIAVALTIPLLGWLLGRFVSGVFVPRYALSVVPAISIAIAAVVWRLNTRRSAAELFLCAVLAWCVGWETVDALRRWPPAAADPVAGRQLLLQSLRSPHPTIVSSGLQFVQFWYYLPPALKPRLHYVADPDKAFRRTGSDTIDRGYLALSRWTALPVDRYDTFVDRNPEFHLYQSGAGWVVDQLESDGVTVQPKGRETGGRLYRATVSR